MNRLKEYREKAELSQTQLAHITQISQVIISRIERNQETAWPKWRKKLAIALNATEEELFPDEVQNEKAKANAKAEQEAKIQRLRREVIGGDRT